MYVSAFMLSNILQTRMHIRGRHCDVVVRRSAPCVRGRRDSSMKVQNCSEAFGRKDMVTRSLVSRNRPKSWKVSFDYVVGGKDQRFQ